MNARMRSVRIESTLSHLREVAGAAAVLVSLACGATASGQGLANGGFETPEAIGGKLPTVFADWDADPATIVLTENGITPCEGSRMLRFDNTSLTGNSSGSGCDVHQLVDVSALAGLIQTGSVTATVSARFNRVAGNSQTDTEFAVAIYAFDGLPTAYDNKSPNMIPSLGSSADSVLSDSDVKTWELGIASLELPPKTTYISVTVHAVENVFNNSTQPEFDGHYVDDVVLRFARFENLGNGLAGKNGVPDLAGKGALLGGDPVTVRLENAKENSTAVLIIGASLLNVPLMGGTLVPSPNLLIFGLPTDGNGALELSSKWPTGAPSGVSIYFQYWIVDPAGPLGYSASNGLAITPP